MGYKEQDDGAYVLDVEFTAVDTRGEIAPRSNRTFSMAAKKAGKGGEVLVYEVWTNDDGLVWSKLVHRIKVSA